MSNIDVFGIGNPLVDLLASVSDQFLKEQNLEKNRMYLVDEDSQSTILEKLKAANTEITITPGGSCANTMIGIGQLGGNSAYSGRVGKDEHGDIYISKLQNATVTSSVGVGEGMTGSSLILVTDDGARCMNTHLGMCQEFHHSDVNEDLLKQAQYLYIEGYLWDTESQKEAIQKTIEKAKSLDVKVSLSLSDPFCVHRNGEAFWELIKGDVQLLFCNQEEAHAMANTTITQDAIQELGKHVETVIVTLGEHGALILNKGEITYIDPLPVEVVDTTGAGDAFAAGFLYGVTQGRTMVECGRLAAMLASLVIGQMGPRYAGDLQEHVSSILG